MHLLPQAVCLHFLQRGRLWAAWGVASPGLRCAVRHGGSSQASPACPKACACAPLACRRCSARSTPASARACKVREMGRAYWRGGPSSPGADVRRGLHAAPAVLPRILPHEQGTRRAAPRLRASRTTAAALRAATPAPPGAPARAATAAPAPAAMRVWEAGRHRVWQRCVGSSHWVSRAQTDATCTPAEPRLWLPPPPPVLFRTTSTRAMARAAPAPPTAACARPRAPPVPPAPLASSTASP